MPTGCWRWPTRRATAVQDPRPRGIFRLGAMESTAAVRLPGPLNEYHRRYPEVALELRTGNPPALVKAILAGELDAALVTVADCGCAVRKGRGVRGRARDRFRRRHAGDRQGKNGIFRDLIAFEHGCPHRKRLEDWYALRGEMPERTIELGSYHAMLGCVVAGMGVALLPKSVLTTFPEGKRLTVHTLPPGENRAETVLIWRKGAGLAEHSGAAAGSVGASSEKSQPSQTQGVMARSHQA